MKKRKIFQLTFSILFSTLLVIGLVYAWTAPTQNPPAGNVEAPINVSDSAQSKLGNFGLGGGEGQSLYWLKNIGGTLYFSSTDPSGDRVVIGQDGNVGIGTTEPNEILTVEGSISLKEQTTTPSVTTGYGKIYIKDDGNLYYKNDEDNEFNLNEGISRVKQLIKEFVVASGENVTAGDVVAFINGYVKKGLNMGTDISYGSEYIFNSAITYYISVSALDSTHFVVAYRDKGNKNYGTAVIGTVSGNSISWGSEYVFDSGGAEHISVSALDSTHFVVAYRDVDNNKYGTAVIGNVCGDSISYGSEYVFNSGYTPYISVSALDSTRFVVAYSDRSNNRYGTAVIGTVSGNAISFGSEYVFNYDGTSYISVSALDPTHFVVAYEDQECGNYGTVKIGTVSGKSISWGSKYVFNAAPTHHISVSALDSTRFVVAYTDCDNNHYGTAIIGTVSGNSISFGFECVFNEGDTSYTSVSALDSTHFVVTYVDDDNNYYGTAVIGIVSGNTVSCGSEYVFYSGSNYHRHAPTSALDSTHFVVAYQDENNNDYGTARIGTRSTSTEGGFIGIAKESASGGETVSVIIGGVADVYSGLSIGGVYYATIDGDITTSPTGYRLGPAISSTEILLNPISFW